VSAKKLSKRARKYLKLLKPGEEQRSMSTLKLRLLKKLKCTLKYEKLAWADGAQLVAGVDEVGRGALFGPVVAAAVILKPDYRIRGLRDSKLLLPEVREVLAERIREHSIAYAIASVDAARVDTVNIYWASLEALAMAVKQLQPAPDHVLVDALKIDVECKQTKIIHGDALSCSIAAASIIAKVERDRWMRDFDLQYPLYGLASNKGYSTPKHKAILRQHGPSPLHRQSFAPVWMSQAEHLPDLFAELQQEMEEPIAFEEELISAES
jgi:ribonuclease HII